VKKDENDNESQVGETIDGQPKLRAHLSRRPHRERDQGDFFVIEEIFQKNMLKLRNKKVNTIKNGSI